MAYDKVVDSALLDAGLKQIADAIREKAGVSGEFYFPTDFAEMIKAIEAGGAANVVCGEITPSENVKSISITHNLGVVPQFFFLTTTTYNRTSDGIWGVMGARTTGSTAGYPGVIITKKSAYSADVALSTINPGYELVKLINASLINLGDDGTGKFYSAGNTYIWVVGVIQ